MKTNRLMKFVLRTVSSASILPILSVLAFGVELPDQALSHANPRVQAVIAAQEAATPDLMAMPDVLGTAVGQDDDGEVKIVVYVNKEGKNPAKSVRNVPESLHGEKIIVQLTEPFRALVKPTSPTSPVSHTEKQSTPIKLGTSGGWRNDLANGYCCGGTLGSLIKITTGTEQTQYILSNYHVFESDIVAGSNGVATTGDYIIQPGLIDTGCGTSTVQNVATLNKISALPSSLPSKNVDASIAQVQPEMVISSGDILEIGPISSVTAKASLRKAVKKSGRTTGLTRSAISGLNGTISVDYDNECAGGHAFTQVFTGQIIIKNLASKFLAGGDSGSLMVEDIATTPKAVGLLFAGNSSLAVANPIDDVLDFLGATMVGQ